MWLGSHGFHRIILQTVWGIATSAKQIEKTDVDVVVRMPNFPLGDHSILHHYIKILGGSFP